MNNASPTQIAQFKAVYPQMFPGGNPVPIFTYILPECDPAPCIDSVSSGGVLQFSRKHHGRGNHANRHGPHTGRAKRLAEAH
jgi:hypothetical protein